MKTPYKPENLTRWTMPSSYFGATWEPYYGAGFGQSRDSSELEASNFAVVQRELAKLAPWNPPAEATPPDIPSYVDEHETVPSRYVVRENHWAVGWVEWIAIHELDTEALQLCDKLKGDCDDYPVLDEQDFSEREEESAHTVWKDCYRQKDRVEYIRKHRSQFEFRDFADLLGCARGNYFAGYASELLS